MSRIWQVAVDEQVGKAFLASALTGGEGELVCSGCKTFGVEVPEADADAMKARAEALAERYYHRPEERPTQCGHCQVHFVDTFSDANQGLCRPCMNQAMREGSCGYCGTYTPHFRGRCDGCHAPR